LRSIVDRKAKKAFLDKELRRRPASRLVAEKPPDGRFPAPDASQKKFNGRLVAPTWVINSSPLIFSGELFLFAVK
jgi:hypothetical protein